MVSVCGGCSEVLAKGKCIEFESTAFYINYYRPWLIVVIQADIV